jgi:hypothetical protein
MMYVFVGKGNGNSTKKVSIYQHIIGDLWASFEFMATWFRQRQDYLNFSTNQNIIKIFK